MDGRVENRIMRNNNIGNNVESKGRVLLLLFTNTDSSETLCERKYGLQIRNVVISENFFEFCEIIFIMLKNE